MKTTNGSLLFAIGSLHEIVCVLGGLGVIAPPGAVPRNLIAEIVRDGILNAVAHDPLRSALFWSAFCGLALLLLGYLLHTLEASGQPLPAATGWQLAAFALAGGLLIPVSGFWLALPVAWRLVRAGRSTSRPDSSTFRAGVERSLAPSTRAR